MAPPVPTYEAWQVAVTASFHPNRINASTCVNAGLMETVKNIRAIVSAYLDEVGAHLGDLERILKSKMVFKLLSSIRFNIGKAFKAVQTATHLLPKGLNRVIHELATTKVVKDLQSGAAAVDAFLDRHPVLKTMGSLAIAGFLLWLWLNACFLGDFSYDFDLSDVALALSGKATVSLLFTESVLELMTLSLVGVTTGLSFPWVGNSMIELVLAVIVSASKQMRLRDMWSKTRTLIERKAL